jgi:hypothetical protein
VPVITWIALVFFLVATAGNGIYAGLRAWRSFKTLGSVATSLAGGLDAVANSADEAIRRATGLSAGTERLSRELGSLAESRAELSVLLGALARVRSTLDGFTGVVYGK